MELLEVPFKNGYSEFVEYFSKEITVLVPENLEEFEYRVDLIEEEVVSNNISFINILNKDIDFELDLKNDGKNYIHIKSNNNFLGGLKLKVSYTYKNNNPQGFYSVDYDLGLIYFSEKTPSKLLVEYNYDSMFCTGKEAEQLLSEDYNIVNKNINIKNFKDNSLIYFLYTKTNTEHRNLTPILKDLKLNYIIKDSTSL